MTSGRHKQPSALGIGPPHPDEPQPELLSDIPPCPDFLTGAAAEEWDRAAHELIDVGILSDLDLPLLATWCQQWKIWRACVDRMNKLEAEDPETRGVIVKSATGAAYQNPVLGAMNAAARELRKLGQELGLSPSGRAGVKVDPLRPSAAKRNASLIAQKFGLA